MIQRYQIEPWVSDCVCDDSYAEWDIFPCSAGNWVRVEDAEKLERSLAAAQTEIKDLKEELARYRQAVASMLAFPA